MPLLTFQDAQGAAHRVQIAETEDVRLGTDAQWSNVLLPDEMGVIPRHAILSRSGLNRLLMLLDLSGDQTWVNQHPVVRIRVLRQGDRVLLGRCTLDVWEVQIRTLQPGDAAVGQKCPVSRRVLKVGDEVITCPGCGAVHERDAWFLIERCAAGCGYPNREVMMDTLPAWIAIERHLDQESRLIEKVENGQVLQVGETCRAGQARDQVPFQEGQNALYCPSCQSPFHLECFLTLPACPVCQYDISALIRQTLNADGEEAVRP
jgi:hypothetical protein